MKKPTTTINKAQLLAALKQLNGCAIGSMDTLTVVKLTGGKSNPMLNRVTKLSLGGNVLFFTNNLEGNNTYRDMVQKRLEQEGKSASDFTLRPRAWGERIPATPFVLNKGQLYVEVVYLNAPKEVVYFLDDQVVKKEDIIGLPDKTESEQGGLDNKVIIRDYKLESIKRIKMGKLSVEAI